jgi:hypothetical protein
MPLDGGASDAWVAAVVRTVSVEVPEPVTELGANEHVGAGVTAGAMLQARVTVPLKPFTGEIVTVAVADPPGAMVAGESAVAAMVKSGGAGLLKV